MNSKTALIVVVALAGSAAAGLAQARGQADVQWSVTIGPGAGGPVYLPAELAYMPSQPVYMPAPPAYVRPVPMPRYVHYRHPTRWDVDGDGVPNRYDRVYNPRWDVDGDGIPNRYDRAYNRRWDADGDGIPNRRDPSPGLPAPHRGR